MSMRKMTVARGRSSEGWPSPIEHNKEINISAVTEDTAGDSLGGRRTLLCEWDEPTHGPDPAGHGDDAVKRDAPAQLELDRVLGRHDQKVVERVGGRVDEERVVVERHEVDRSRQGDGRHMRLRRQRVVPRVQSDLRRDRRQVSEQRSSTRSTCRDGRTEKSFPSSIPATRTCKNQTMPPRTRKFSSHSARSNSFHLPLPLLQWVSPRRPATATSLPSSDTVAYRIGYCTVMYACGREIGSHSDDEGVREDR